MTATATTHPPSAPAAAVPADPRAPSGPRAGIVARVRDVLDATGRPWAWQGESGAVSTWVAATGPKDLDVWCADPGPGALAALLDRLDGVLGARVGEALDPRRLRHVTWAAETPSGLAVVDLTVGDLAVGARRLLGQDEVTVAPGELGPRLTGAAAVADLFLRRLLRGAAPGPDRYAEARAAYAACPEHERRRADALVARALGRGAPAGIATLRGAPLPAGAPRRARLGLLAATVTRGLPAAARAWRSVLPAGPLAGPAGLRRRGAVVVLVGTDGSGKSTTGAELGRRLAVAGVPVAHAYFGMARGNLPGVGLARRVLRVGGTATSGAPRGDGGRTGAALDHPRLRRVAAWYYAAEYAVRWATLVGPRRARGRVVVVDRWVWDLRESPWPGSRASAWVERIVPAPDVVALADAPAATIHARKPERTLAEQAAQQEAFRRILAERPARCREVVVDTSGAAPDPCADLVAAAIGAAHLRRRAGG